MVLHSMTFLINDKPVIMKHTLLGMLIALPFYYLKLKLSLKLPKHWRETCRVGRQAVEVTLAAEAL